MTAGLLADPDEVRAHLIGCAVAGSEISYSELLERLGYAFSRPKMRALCKVLSKIDDDAAAAGEPELAVLVVRQSDGLPGQGWWLGRSETHGYTGLWDGPDARQRVTRLQGQAFDYWRRNS